jgi:hypothetical protein
MLSLTSSLLLLLSLSFPSVTQKDFNVSSFIVAQSQKKLSEIPLVMPQVDVVIVKGGSYRGRLISLDAKTGSIILDTSLYGQKMISIDRISNLARVDNNEGIPDSSTRPPKIRGQDNAKAKTYTLEKLPLGALIVNHGSVTVSLASMTPIKQKEISSIVGSKKAEYVIDQIIFERQVKTKKITLKVTPRDKISK